MNEWELFQQAQMGSKAAKEKIVSDNTGLVWSIARRFVNRGYDLEELYQIGCIGLLKACDRFESRYGVQFSTYAVPLIAGEIKRFLRDNGAIKVSRILKQNGYQISKAKEALLHKYGREATLDELADYTGLCVEDIVMATEANREVESIQQTICGKDGTQVSLVERLVDEAQSEVAAENIMNRILVGQAMEKLGDVEAIIHADAAQFAEIEKIGDVIAEGIVAYFADPNNIRVLREILKEVTLVVEENTAPQDLEGKTFVITGSLNHFANRDELKKLIEDRGGKVAGSVSSKTTYLINNDVLSSSSKNKKAKSLGISIISEDDFLQL